MGMRFRKSVKICMCYMAIGRLAKAAEYLDMALTASEQDKNYSFFASYRKYFSILFVTPLIAENHAAAIQEIKALKIHYTKAEESKIFDILDSEPEYAETLTEREREIARLVAQGLRNAEIAETLHVSENTVKTHLKTIFKKMNIDRRSKLVELLK